MIESGSCIVRKDRTVLLDCAHAGSKTAGRKLGMFAELIKNPPAFHTYRITPLSLWNAAAQGHHAERVITQLQELSRWELPAGLAEEITMLMSRYGKLTLHSGDAGSISLCSEEPVLVEELEHHRELKHLNLARTGPLSLKCPAELRGQLKQDLTALGYPVLDFAGYHEGQALQVEWSRKETGETFRLRDYQQEAVQQFRGTAGNEGSGVVVLPCGAGKTIVGIAVLESLQCETLILTSNTTSVRQWIEELEWRTSLTNEEIGEYSGEQRQVRPVTVATYQMLTHRRTKGGPFLHMNLFNERNWGLIIYDEVHLLPAPVFRATAEIQATRRLGLTATLVREDGREGDVFSLIGPKRYDLPWKVLEQRGWIASVECTEMLVPMSAAWRRDYTYAGSREKFRLAAVNPVKLAAASRLLQEHKGAGVLIIGQYLDQLNELSAALDVPLITGKTPQRERDALYAAFNEGAIPVLIVSKVANFAVNLPDASVAIEVSGSFGSRQEEAQRLGRILRPKAGDNKAYFYTLVSGDSREQEFARQRRLFLTEQGYQYHVRSEPLVEEERR